MCYGYCKFYCINLPTDVSISTHKKKKSKNTTNFTKK